MTQFITAQSYTVRSRDELESLRQKLDAIVVDGMRDQLEDIFLLRNPRFKFVPHHEEELKLFIESVTPPEGLHAYGTWFFFPWSKMLTHCLPEDEWYEVRTGRNHNLITKAEQKAFADKHVAIAGLSVGSHIALTIAMMGGSRAMTIADPDVLSPSNLNRIRAGSSAIGKKKAHIVAEALCELEPYGSYTVMEDGVNKDNLDEFFRDVDIVIEETDKLELKILLREEARRRRCPVLMGTDNGDGVIIDVERYDLHPELQLFNGAVGDLTLEMFQNFPPKDLPMLATKIAGPELAHQRMKDSILEVGHTLYSWPQLGSAATACGAVIAYAARRIAAGLPLHEGKYAIDLDAILDPFYETSEAVSDRRQHHAEFMKRIGLA
jgi:molybdopterin/thiamine biosynthesis adenylyltransferase